MGDLCAFKGFPRRHRLTAPFAGRREKDSCYERRTPTLVQAIAWRPHGALARRVGVGEVIDPCKSMRDKKSAARKAVPKDGKQFGRGVFVRGARQDARGAARASQFPSYRPSGAAPSKYPMACDWMMGARACREVPTGARAPTSAFALFQFFLTDFVFKSIVAPFPWIFLPEGKGGPPCHTIVTKSAIRRRPGPV